MALASPRPAAPVAVLALPFLLTACAAFGDDLANDEQVAADHEATEAMVQAVLDVHAAQMNSRRPARLVMGDWQYIAEANTDWSHRLATALRGLEEQMMGDSPEAPWLLVSDVIDESGVVFAVHDLEDRANCCPTVAVHVWLRNGRLEFRASDGVGYVHYVRPPHEVRRSLLAEEEQYIKDRKSGCQHARRRRGAVPGT